MELKGWQYSGLNISDKLHNEFVQFVDFFIENSTDQSLEWNTNLQTKIQEYMGLDLDRDGNKKNSSGIIRTKKSAFHELNFIIDNINTVIPVRATHFVTQVGWIIYHITKLKNNIDELKIENKDTLKKIYHSINSIYSSIYAEHFATFVWKNGPRKDTNEIFHPLREVLIALRKYTTLSPTEWYLLTTHIESNFSDEGYKKLDIHMTDYRAEQIEEDNLQITHNVKSHQYLPNHFLHAGFIKLDKRSWEVMSENTLFPKIKNIIISDQFLSLLQTVNVERSPSMSITSTDMLDEGISEIRENINYHLTEIEKLIDFTGGNRKITTWIVVIPPPSELEELTKIHVERTNNMSIGDEIALFLKPDITCHGIYKVTNLISENEIEIALVQSFSNKITIELLAASNIDSDILEYLKTYI